MLPLCWRLRQPTLFNNRPTIDRNLAQSPPPMWYQGGRLAVARWLCFLGPARWFAAVFFLKRVYFVRVLNRRGSGWIGISAGGWRRKVCNQSVTAAHPAANAVCEPERQLVNSENRR